MPILVRTYVTDSDMFKMSPLIPDMSKLIPKVFGAILQGVGGGAPKSEAILQGVGGGAPKSEANPQGV